MTRHGEPLGQFLGGSVRSLPQTSFYVKRIRKRNSGLYQSKNARLDVTERLQSPAADPNGRFLFLTEADFRRERFGSLYDPPPKVNERNRDSRHLSSSPLGAEAAFPTPLTQSRTYATFHLEATPLV